MDDKTMYYAALIGAALIAVVMWWEYRPSFFWLRYIVGLEKTAPDEMEWDEVVRRIRERVQKAYRHQRNCLSNGIYVTPYEPDSQRLMLYPKRGRNPHIPLVIIEPQNTVRVVAVYNVGDDGFDPYQWMMEQMSNDTCYEIAKRSYICEQDSSRGHAERVKVEQEYIHWITRKFI